MGLFNLFRTDNPNNDPYWVFDELHHHKVKLNLEVFFKLTGFDFGWFVLEPISVYIKDVQGELVKGRTLSYAQKALYYWWYVDAQVTNGGFIQYYFNGYGKYMPTTIKAIEYVGDSNMAELLKRSYEIFQKHSTRIADARSGDNNAFSTLYKDITDFEKVDAEYYSLHGKTMRHIENYIRKHPNEVCVDEYGKSFDMTFTGELVIRYPNGNTKAIIPMSSGIISGVFKSFFENQMIQEEVFFETGEQTGERVEYYENGNKKYSIRKDLSKNQFEHYWYYPNGSSSKLEHKLIDTGKRTGEYKQWYENGQLAKTGTYISELEREGGWHEFYDNGSKKLEAEFKNGDFLIHSFWNETGAQILLNGTGLYINEYSIFVGEIDRNEDEYKNYKRHGKQQSFKNGKLSLLQEMIEGKSHGVTKSFDTDGNLVYESVYENGVEKSRKEYL